MKTTAVYLWLMLISSVFSARAQTPIWVDQTMEQIQAIYDSTQWYGRIPPPLYKQLDSVIAHLQTQNSMHYRAVLGRAYVMKANELMSSNEDPQAKILLSKALILLNGSQSDDTTRVYVAQTHSLLGMISEHMLQAEDAMMEHQMAGIMFDSMGLKQGAFAELFNVIQAANQLGDLDMTRKALESAEYSLPVVPLEQSLHFKFNKAMWLYQLAEEQMGFSKINNCRVLAKQALRLAESLADTLVYLKKQGQPIPWLQSSQVAITTFIATVMVMLDDYSIAQPDTALQRAWAVPRPYSPMVSSTLQLVSAKAYFIKKIYTTALDTIQLSLKTLGYYSTNPLLNPPLVINSSEILRVFIPAIVLKSAILFKMYDVNQDIAYLESSFDCQLKAMAAMDSLRLFYISEGGMKGLSRRFSLYYHLATWIAATLYQKTGNEKYFNAVLEWTEKKKAFQLRNLVYGRVKAQQYMAEQKQLLERVQNFIRQIAILQKDVNNGSSRAIQRLIKLKTTYNNFIDSLKQLPANTEGARFYAERYDNYVPTRANIRADFLNKENQPNIIYLGISSSNLYTILSLITRTKDTILIISHPPSFYDTLRFLQQSLSNAPLTENAQKQFIKWASAVSNRLIKPLMDTQMMTEKGEILLSSDGIWRSIPLDILFYEKPKTQRYTDLPYLLNRYAFNHTLSLGLYRWQSRLNETERRDGLGVFSANYDSTILKPLADIMPLSTLPNLDAAAMKVSGMKGVSPIFMRATKKTFINNIERFNGLLLALHGATTKTDSNNYCLFFYPNHSVFDSLTIAEIYNLPLSNLAFTYLAACETVLGKEDASEGPLGLARAFMYAGCRSVVASLGRIPDKPSALITESFFNILSTPTHPSTSEALRQAKMDYIHKQSKDPQLAHPRYFANLIIFGKGE